MSEELENVHAATDPQKCRDMGKRYGWELLGWRKTNNPVLKVDCVFKGEQTSFEDERDEGNLDSVQN